MKPIGLIAYARHRKARGMSGGDLSSVRAAIADGRITTINGKIDPEIADKQWAENTQNAESESYSAARARKEAAQADLAEMEAGELRGELYRRDDVVNTWGEMMAAIRSRLLILPSMAAPQVAPGRAAEAQAILQKLVHEALSELGEGLPKRTGRGKRGHASSATAA